MRNIITSILLVAVVIGGHEYMQHDMFMYFLGAMWTVALALFLLTAVSFIITSESITGFWEKYQEHSKATLIVGRISTIVLLVYAAYTEHYVVASLGIAAAVLGLMLVETAKKVNSEV